jgi:hypothetical protein
VANERIAARNPVPGSRIEAGNARRNPGEDFGFAVGLALKWVSRPK